MHEYYCIGFKSLLDYKNLFSPDDHEQNDNTKKNEKDEKIYCVISGKYRKSEEPRISYLLEKILVLSHICSTCKSE